MLLIEIYLIQPTPPYPERVNIFHIYYPERVNIFHIYYPERVNIFHIYYQAVPVRVPPIAPVIVVSLQTT